MSDPVAAEEDALRERLRRAENEGVRLSAEKARVARLLAPRPGGSRGWLAGLAIAMVVGVLAFGASWAMASQRATEEGKRQQAALKAETVEEQRKVNECKLAEFRAKRALHACRATSPLRPTPPDPLDPGPLQSRCTCQPGDPLCSCL
jgi:uncharacterized protein HemX